MCCQFFEFGNRTVRLHLNPRLRPAETIRGLGDVALFQIPQRQYKTVARRQLRQKPMHQFGGLPRINSVVVGLAQLLPCLVGQRDGFAPADSTPVVITDAGGDASQPMAKGRFGTKPRQTQVRFDECLLDEFFVFGAVAGKPPEEFANGCLMPLNKAAVSVGIAVLALTDILNLAGMKRNRLFCLSKTESRLYNGDDA